jgi:5-methylcytosine-specific restriction endonuclease McrA
MVYVLDKNGQPLMPTDRHGKVKHLLRQGRAKVLNRCPFTIQLTYDTMAHTQPIILGIDAGSKQIGLSATANSKEVYAAEVSLRTDIVDLLSTRRQFRRARRSRKTRHRQPRFDNRRREDGWLTPSIRQKIDTHLKAVEQVNKILPVTSIVVEIASFDIQRIKKPDIYGVEYQQGEQLGFWNIREYVLFRDNHQCQHCKGKTKDKILDVHHIESRKTGGNTPNNLITLCGTCHDSYHAGHIQIKAKRGVSFRDAATPLLYYLSQKAVRRHNRQLHRATVSKGGQRKANQAPRTVHGFRLFDKVLYNGQECFIFGRRSSGYFDLRMLGGEKVHASAKAKELVLLQPAATLLTERRAAIPPLP